MITVSTDGSALGNPNGPMGWAWADHDVDAARTPGHSHDGDCDAGGATNGTNQIGELVAVLEALRAHPGDEPLTIETDSQYAINCSTKWVKGWKKNGWKNSQKKPVKNAPLIKAIDAEIADREGPVKFVWVKGHNGNPGNEKVDDLAHTYSGDARSGVKDGYLPLEGWQSLLASDYARGVDIPADAQLLIDGEITNEEYHLGRGESSGSSAATSAPNSEFAGATPGSRSSHTSRTLNDLFDEPEGVPDYDFGHSSSSNSSNSNDSTNASSSSHQVADDASDVQQNTDESATPRSQGAANVSREANDGATSAAATGSSKSNNTAPASAHQNAPALRASSLNASGLTVSGTVQVSPPPSSSATYTGQPKHLHGFVEVDAMVAGDGTVTLQAAPLFIGGAN